MEERTVGEHSIRRRKLIGDRLAGTNAHGLGRARQRDEKEEGDDLQDASRMEHGFALGVDRVRAKRGGRSG
jgi:hypothetical protein